MNDRSVHFLIFFFLGGREEGFSFYLVVAKKMAAKRARPATAVTTTVVLEGGMGTADKNPPPPPPKWWIPVGLLLDEGSMEGLRWRKPKLPLPLNFFLRVFLFPFSFVDCFAFSNLNSSFFLLCFPDWVLVYSAARPINEGVFELCVYLDSTP